MRNDDAQPLFDADDQLQALEDPRVTDAFARMDAALSSSESNPKRRLKVSHLVVMAVVLAALPATLLWVLGL